MILDDHILGGLAPKNQFWQNTIFDFSHTQHKFDFFPHLYWEVRFVCKAHFGSQKRATVPWCTKTHWTKQTSEYTWILIISWKTGGLGVNKANFSKIRKILIFDPPKILFFYYAKSIFSLNNDTWWSYEGGLAAKNQFWQNIILIFCKYRYLVKKWTLYSKKTIF